MADGTITFDTRLDNYQLEKDLKKAEESIAAEEKELQGLQKELESTRKQEVLKAAELDAERKSLDDIKSRLEDIRELSKDTAIPESDRSRYNEALPDIEREEKAQTDLVSLLSKDYDNVRESVVDCSSAVEEATERINRQKAAANSLQQQLSAKEPVSLLDIRKLEKDLKKAEESIATEERKLQGLQKELESTHEMEVLQGAELDEEKRKLQEIKDRLSDIRKLSKDKSVPAADRKRYKEMIPDVAAEQKEQAERVRGLQTEYNGIYNTVERTKKTIAKTTNSIEEQQTSVNALRQQLADRQDALRNIRASAEMADQAIIRLQEELRLLKARQEELRQAGVGVGYQEYDENERRIAEINAELKKYRANLLQAADAETEMGKAMSGVEHRIDKLGKRIAGLAKRVFVFSMITSALRSMRSYMGSVIATNDEASTSFAQLKGALFTLAQPIISVLIPAFTMLCNVLTRAATAAAGFVSMLFGKTIGQSKAAAKALNSEVAALEGVGGAAKEAAGSLAGFDEINQLAGDTSAGGGATQTVDFDFDTSAMDQDFSKILNWIKLIGAALLSWKLSKTFTGGLRTFAGLILAINGGIELASGTWDAWQNGADMDNFLQMLQGAALLVAGLTIAFDTLGGGIGLVVSSIVMLVTGFHDAMENGWNLENELMVITGIMGAGLGIYVLTGNWIPVLIAAIAVLLLKLANATGHGEELIEGVRKVCQGFLDFITGIFSGDMEKALAGIGQMFDGFREIAGAVIDGVKDTLLSFLDWLDEKTNGKFHGVIETAKKFITVFFDGIKSFVSGSIDSIKQIFSGLVQFISGVFTNDWDRAWSGLKDIFRGIVNAIISVFEGMVNFIISGLNSVIRGMNRFTSFTLPDWMGGQSFSGINIQEITPISIPRLATGAVIPPNREFLAVLGDQKSGRNIEAPESLIRKIVREESGGETTELLRSILEAVKAGHVLVVDQAVLARVAVKGINNLTMQAGKSVLNL